MTAHRGSPNDPVEPKSPDRPADPIGTPVVLDTASLFGRRNEVRVRHNGQEYRLRITRAGKLILTK
jgi:hemin uptake protein HemP